MRLLFDIDYTVLAEPGQAKAALAQGRFGRLVMGHFDEVVCVSDWCAHCASEPTPMAARECILQTMAGAVAPKDTSWFLENMRLCADPEARGAMFNPTTDYWVDDFAHHYIDGRMLERVAAGYLDALPALRTPAARILVCSPHGDGSDVASWLKSIRQGRSDGR